MVEENFPLIYSILLGIGLLLIFLCLGILLTIKLHRRKSYHNKKIPIKQDKNKEDAESLTPDDTSPDVLPARGK